MCIYEKMRLIYCKEWQVEGAYTARSRKVEWLVGSLEFFPVVVFMEEIAAHLMHIRNG